MCVCGGGGGGREDVQTTQKLSIKKDIKEDPIAYKNVQVLSSVMSFGQHR